MVVQQHAHRLPKDTEKTPEHHITHHRVFELVLQEISHNYKRNLKHNTKECPKLEYVARNSNTQLMENSRHKEGNQYCNSLWYSIAQARKVYMTDHPFVDRLQAIKILINVKWKSNYKK